jgi:hypothetical protein
MNLVHSKLVKKGAAAKRRLRLSPPCRLFSGCVIAKLRSLKPNTQFWFRKDSQMKSGVLLANLAGSSFIRALMTDPITKKESVHNTHVALTTEVIVKREDICVG